MTTHIDMTAGHDSREPLGRHFGMQSISVEIDGRTYTGCYAVNGDTVTAYWGVKKYSRTTRGAPPSTIARKALRELVRPLSAGQS